MLWEVPAAPNVTGCNYTAYYGCESESLQWTIIASALNANGTLIGFLFFMFQIPIYGYFLRSRKVAHVARLRGKYSTFSLSISAIFVTIYTLQSTLFVNRVFILELVANDCRVWFMVFVIGVLNFYRQMVTFTGSYYSLYMKQTMLHVGLSNISKSIQGAPQEKGLVVEVTPLESLPEKYSSNKYRNGRSSLVPIQITKEGIIKRTIRQWERRLAAPIHRKQFRLVWNVYNFSVSVLFAILLFGLGIVFQHDWTDSLGTALCMYHPSGPLLLILLTVFLTPNVFTIVILSYSALQASQQTGSDLCGVRSSLKRILESSLLLVAVFGVATPVMLLVPGSLNYVFWIIGLLAAYIVIETSLIPCITGIMLSNGYRSVWEILGIKSMQAETEDYHNWREVANIGPKLVLEKFLQRSEENVSCLHRYLSMEMNLESLTFLLEVFDFEQRFNEMKLSTNTQWVEKSLGKITLNLSSKSELAPTIGSGTMRLVDCSGRVSGEIVPSIVQLAGSTSTTITKDMVGPEASDSTKQLADIKGTESSSEVSVNAKPNNEIVEQKPAQPRKQLDPTRSLPNLLKKSRSKLHLLAKGEEEHMKQMATEAERIVALYLRPDSDFQINVPSHVFSKFENKKGKASKTKVGTESEDFRTNPKCFDQAKQEILFLLIQDNIPRFLAASAKHQKLWMQNVDWCNEELVYDKQENA